MSELIDRVALAICIAKDDGDPNHKFPIVWGSNELVKYWTFHREQAIEVLNAIFHWTKIEGPETEPPDDVLVRVSFNKDVQNDLYCIRFDKKSDSRQWFFFEIETGKLRLLKDYNFSGCVPSHWMMPIKPEPPRNQP